MVLGFLIIKSENQEFALNQNEGEGGFTLLP